jgi:tetratricopeptide (TPR) repeat protein
LAGATLALLLGSGAVPGAALEPPPPPLVLGVDPLARGTILENRQDALAHWAGRGDAGAVLLHVDAEHGLRAVKKQNLAALERLVRSGDLAGVTAAGRGGEAGLFDEGNFVRAAAGLGIVREVVWIAPFPIQAEEDAQKQLRDYLGKAGLSPQESGSFRPQEGCSRGSVGGIPVRVCAQERLPALQGPVLLSIGAAFFPRAAAARGVTPVTEIRWLFNSLRAARYEILDAVFAFSVQGGALPPDQRWIGEAVLEALKDPALLQGEQPPPRWVALQKLFTLVARGPQAEVELLGVALSELEEQPHDPALLLFAAEAAARHNGGGDRALAYAEEACRMDRGYCVGLREIGLRFLERGDVEGGLAFLAAGERLLPGMEYGQLDLGIALMKAGKSAQALAALEKERLRSGDFPSGFLIGATHLFLGDRAAARRAFDAALGALEQAGDVQVVRGEIAYVVETAAAFYREEKLVRQARRLAEDPRLRLPAAAGSP